MATTLVIHHTADETFVKESLVPLLSILGFDWRAGADRPDPRAFDAVLVVVSASALRDLGVMKQANAAIESGCRILPIVLDVATITQLPVELAILPAVHAQLNTEPLDGRRLFDQLSALLRPLARAAKSDGRAVGLSAASAGSPDWRPSVFSSLLKQAVDSYDLFRSAELVESFALHVASPVNHYPANRVSEDLGVLRSKRQFHMLCRYATALFDAGSPTEPVVRRQYAQALIEQKDYERALTLLQSIVKECEPTHKEAIEARGLVGRLFKQRYVDATDGADESLLRQAVESYGEAAELAPGNYWPAINYVSCTLRASRDGFSWADTHDARKRAEGIVNRLEDQWRKEQPQAWDQASYVEALVALEEFVGAEQALGAYLSHRGTDSFEVSSTYRQFVEVLQLDRNERGRALVNRLWTAVDEHRSGGAFSNADSWPATMLVRVSDASWRPSRVPDLKERGRLGTIVSIEGSKATVQALYRDSMVVTVDLGRPMDDVKECRRSLPYVGVSPIYQRGDETYEESGSQALIAVIDNGIDLLHQAFVDSEKRSRIIAIWDQRDSSGPPPSDAGYDPLLTYGRLYNQDEIGAIVTSGVVPQKLGRNFKENDSEYGHGTHVASIAGGRPAGEFVGGVAPDARLAVVIPKTDEPLGYSSALVGALKFIDQLADKVKLPVVVNVSLGTNGGAHDGNSPFEVAFDAFSSGGAKPGRVVVKSAGNEGDTECHVEVFVGQENAGDIKWERFPNNPLWADDIELWWPFANEYAFTLQSPDGSRSTTVHSGQKKVEGVLQDTGVRMVLSERVRDNGMSRLRIRIGGDMSVVPEGTWMLDVYAPVVKNAAVPIHAWIERRGGKRSRFLGSSPRMTLSVPATARSVIAVGSVALGATADAPPRVDSSSSHGPTQDNRDKPDVSAPGVGIIAAKSGTSSDAVAMSGTSMAAPHVTGAVALALSRVQRAGLEPPAANELAAVLCQKTRGYQGQWDPTRGFGTLNVAAFLNAFSIDPREED